MQVLYTYDTDPRPLRVYRDRNHNSTELTRDEAERVAQRIAGNGGYAETWFGSRYGRYGSDPRAM